MNPKRIFLALPSQLQTILLVGVVFVAGFAAGSQTGSITAQGLNTAPPAEAAELFAPFWETYNLIQSQYVDPNDNAITDEQLVDGAIGGLIDSLGDQFSGYMPPEIYQMENEYLEGNFEGIGATIRLNEEANAIEIVSVFESSPAQESGIRPGDLFITVDGVDVQGETQSEVAFRVRGPEGTPVEITMRRGEELIDFTIIRARINIPNLETRVEADNIAYIRLFQFTGNARSEIDAALAEIDVNNRDGLIFDLRGNPGGLLSSAIDVASVFIENGIILTEDFGPGRDPVTFNANGDFADIQVPIVLLVDEGSASASELVAGALQDNDLATILGETTLGKGTVQTWRELANGGGIRLTVARWKTPDGNWIHGEGISPDVVIEWTPEGVEDEADPQLDAAVDFLETLAEAVVTQ